MFYIARVLILLTIFEHVTLAQGYEFKLPEKREEEELRQIHAKSKVKTVRIVSFKTLTDTQSISNGEVKEIHTIDKRGFRIKRTVPKLDGKEVDVEVTYSYNDLGNLTEFQLYDKGKPTYGQRLHYNTNNDLQSTVTIDSKNGVDSSFNNRKVKWEDGKKITTSHIDRPGTILQNLKSTIVEEFDKFRNQYIITHLSGDYVYKKIVYDLDASARIVKESFMKSDDNIGCHTHQYENGLNVCTKTYDKNNILLKIIDREYNSLSLLIKVIDNDLKNNINTLEIYNYEFY